MSKNVAVIFAGGSGARMGSGTPKQFLEINGKPIIVHTLDIFEDHPLVDEIYIACKEEYIKKLQRYVDKFWITKVKGIVPGGASGLESIYNGLKAAKENNDDDAIVMIHDGVRPCIISELIDDLIYTVNEKGTAITCTEMYETPIVSRTGEMVEDVPPRSEYYTAQAPQCFRLGDILKAQEETRKVNPEYTGLVDSCSLMRSMGKDIYLVKGNRGNIKVTTPEDLYIFRAMLQYRETREAFGLTRREVQSRLKNDFQK